MSAAAEHLDHQWMPFTANRDFKAAPRLTVRAEGMYFWNDRGEPILDGSAVPFVRGFVSRGVRRLDAPVMAFEVLKTVTVTEGEASATLSPADTLRIEAERELSIDRSVRTTGGPLTLMSGESVILSGSLDTTAVGAGGATSSASRR